MKTLLRLLAPALIAGGLALAPSAQAADARILPEGALTPCAIMAEFRHTEPGMTREEVETILDGPGRPSSVRLPAGTVQREYRICGRRWERGRLVARYGTADRLNGLFWLQPQAGTLD